ncbi:hypothetical protein ABT186_02160 [Streptomyces sp. NPDC001634]|uniref:hypothetical protein n=1 Tax=Streptomyces sp. NPDC001634 TaxID=3154390 RepID=UPI0033255CAF
MGFLSRYSGTDIIDLGDSYSVTILQHLPGDAQEAAEAAKVKAVANVESDGENRTVAVETSQDMARYTTLLLHAAIVGWNLTDERDQLLPLAPDEQRLASIKRLPAEVRTRLREHIEANMKAEVRTPDEQRQFRGAGDGGAPVGEGWPGDPAGSPAPGGVLDPAGSL